MLTDVLELLQQLEKEKEENKRLQQQLEQKDRRIAELERQVAMLNKVLTIFFVIYIFFNQLAIFPFFAKAFHEPLIHFLLKVLRIEKMKFLSLHQKNTRNRIKQGYNFAKNTYVVGSEFKVVVNIRHDKPCRHICMVAVIEISCC
jgi:hypothetical protein